MSLKNLTKKIPFWELSLVTLFFFTGYGVAAYKQSNPFSQEKFAVKSKPFHYDNELSDLNLNLDNFLAGLEETEWMSDFTPPTQKSRDPHQSKQRKYIHALKKNRSATSNASQNAALKKSTKAPISSKKISAAQKRRLNNRVKILPDSALAFNGQQHEPLFDQEDLEKLPQGNDTNSQNNAEERESKKLLESLYALSGSGSPEDAFGPKEDSEQTTPKEKAKKKLKKKKNKVTHSSDASENRMADSASNQDTFLNSWGEQTEDSFAVAMHNQGGTLAENSADKDIYDSGYDSSDWFANAAQAQTPEVTPHPMPPISNFIGESTSLQSSRKIFSSQDQDGLKGRAFDQEDYEYLTKDSLNNSENGTATQAARGSAFSASEGSGQFDEGGYDSQMENYSNLTEFQQAPQTVEICDPLPPPLRPVPLLRPLPQRPVPYGWRARRPPPPSGFRPGYPPPRAMHSRLPPPPPQWR